MPATSRSGERFRRRSGSGRAGSPSKSSTTQPRSESIVWPRCRSPWVRITRPPAVDVRERVELLAHVLAAAADRRDGLGVRQVEEDALDLLVDVGVQDRERLGGRLVGREGRVGVVAAERRVQLADHDAERLDAVEQAVRVARRARPAPAPSRRGRRPGTPAGSRASRTDVAPVDLVPARQRGDVREAARGQEAQQLELRVHARLDLAERLHDQLVAEHDRRVRLLDADRAHVDGAAEAGAAPPSGRRTRPGVGGWRASRAAARGRRPGRRARRRRSSRRPRRSPARSSPRRPAAGRAAPGRSRACRSGSGPRSGVSTSSGGSVRSGTESMIAMLDTSRVLDANQRWATIHSLKTCSSRNDRSTVVTLVIPAHPSRAGTNRNRAVRA